jgi:hypothetical protein
MRQFRVKATDFTRQRVLTWRRVVVLIVSGHKVSLQNAVNKFFSAVGEVWRVVTASAYSQARQKVQPEVFVHLNEVACEEYYTRYGAEGEVEVWHATPRTEIPQIPPGAAGRGPGRFGVRWPE